MDFAIISLVQKKHNGITGNNTSDTNITKGCGYTAPYYKIPFKPGYTISLGRSPEIDFSDEVIYIPSDYITRHIGYIRCVESIDGLLLHILTVETNKLPIYTEIGNPIPREYIFRDGDILKLDGLPITLYYTHEKTIGIPIPETELEDPNSTLT